MTIGTYHVVEKIKKQASTFTFTMKKKGLVLDYKSVDSLKFFNRDMHKLYLTELISIKYSLYNLRNKFASYLANNDVDVSNVQQLLNHSDIRITQGHYVRTQTNYLRKKIDKVDFGEIVRQRDIYEQVEDYSIKASELKNKK